MNESQFRARNEVTNEQHPGAGRTAFLCECAQKTCEVTLVLSPEEYEDVRKVATHFVVAPGHVMRDVERVVSATPGYEVVEKIEDAAKVATVLDPRS